MFVSVGLHLSSVLRYVSNQSSTDTNTSFTTSMTLSLGSTNGRSTQTDTKYTSCIAHSTQVSTNGLIAVAHTRRLTKTILLASSSATESLCLRSGWTPLNASSSFDCCWSASRVLNALYATTEAKVRQIASNAKAATREQIEATDFVWNWLISEMLHRRKNWNASIIALI